MTDLEDLPARSVALDAVIRTAVEKADASHWNRRFTSEDVAGRLEADVSARTVRRALKDAEALEWIQKRSPNAKKWRPGPRAEEIDEAAGPDGLLVDDVEAWSCDFCQNIILAENEPEKCPNCRSEDEDIAKRNVTVDGGAAAGRGHI